MTNLDSIFKSTTSWTPRWPSESWVSKKRLAHGHRGQACLGAKRDCSVDLEAGSGARGSQELSSEFSGALGVHGRAGFEALLGHRRAPQTWPSLDGAASRPPDPRDREAPRPELPEAAGQRPGALVRELVRCPVLVPPRLRGRGGADPPGGRRRRGQGRVVPGSAAP